LYRCLDSLFVGTKILANTGDCICPVLVNSARDRISGLAMEILSLAITYHRCQSLWVDGNWPRLFGYLVDRLLELSRRDLMVTEPVTRVE
jgi:hypothetical protein